jgi:hypothetical protein
MLIFIPAVMYLELMTGQSGMTGGSWFMLLLAIEFSRIAGVKITKQEATIIYLMGSGLTLPWFSDVIFNAWFKNSDIANYFGFGAQIPYWAAPDLAGFLSRSLMHPSFLVPVALRVTYSVVSTFFMFGLAMFTRKFYMETEKLPFPMATVRGQMIITLVDEKKEHPARILSVAAIAGFSWAFLLYTLPFIFQIITGEYRQILPVPWVDWTPKVSQYLPGAIVGMSTDIIPFTLGLILPFTTIIQMLAGSLSIFVVGNHISILQNPPYGPFNWWFPQMNASDAIQRSILYIWATPVIGFALAAGLAPLLFNPHLIGRVFSFRKTSKAEEFTIPGGPKIGLWANLFLTGIIYSVILYLILVPDFIGQAPWFLIFIVSVPFILSLVGGRSLGEVGVGIDLSSMTNVVLYLANAPVPAWFVRSDISMSGAGTLSNLKICELTETKGSSYVTSYCVIFWPIAIAVSFLFANIFWGLAPVPSSKYPGAAIFWPIQASYKAVWISGREAGLFNPLNIIVSFIIGIAVYGVGHFAYAPISVIALAAGMTSTPHFMLTSFFGSIIATIIKKYIGNEVFNEYRYILAGGLILGEGIAVTVAVAIAIINTSMWILPW